MIQATSWPKIIVHVDMDAFFAQIEQRDFPELQGKPVAITNGELGSCIITRSYEARQFGVKTGMRLKVAKALCPDLIQCASRPGVYAYVSSQFMSVLETITPDIEIFSVDEVFLDLSRCRSLYHSLDCVAQLIKQRVWDATGLTCSVGVSGDRTTAKVASKQNKPDGLVIIPPWRARAVLAPMLVTELCGISTGIAQFLAQYGVYRCGQITRIPMSVLGRRFGNVGRRIWKMCFGEDPEPVRTTIPHLPRSMGHGKVLPPNTTNEAMILGYLCHMAEKLGARLRENRMSAQRFFVGLKTKKNGLGGQYKTVYPSNDGLIIYRLAKLCVEANWHGEGVFQCQITALDPQPNGGQLDFFVSPDDQRDTINQVMDEINHKFGMHSLISATRIKPLNMPDVISPAWRPTGPRATVKKFKVP